MTPDPTRDPFTFVHRLIWDALNDYEPFADAMGSDIRFDRGDRIPEADQALQAGATPRVILTQGAYDPRAFHFDAGALDMTLSHPLIIVGEGMDVLPVNLLKWYALCAVITAGPYLGRPELIREVKLRRGQDDPLGPNQWKQGHQRWLSMLTIDVLVTIPEEDVLAGTYPGAAA